MENIYNMKLHAAIYLEWCVIIRVPGGWIYRLEKIDVFVPFDNEFMENRSNSFLPY